MFLFEPRKAFFCLFFGFFKLFIICRTLKVKRYFRTDFILYLFLRTYNIIMALGKCQIALKQGFEKHVAEYNTKELNNLEL